MNKRKLLVLCVIGIVVGVIAVFPRWKQTRPSSTRTVSNLKKVGADFRLGANDVTLTYVVPLTSVTNSQP